MKAAASSSGIYSLDVFGPSVELFFSGSEFDLSSRPQYLQKAGIDPNKLALVKQVHGSEIAKVDSSFHFDRQIQADALITDCPGVALGILTADCLPVFFWDPSQKVIGMAHAGWRGLHLEILAKVIDSFVSHYSSNPGNLNVVFGPAIGKCCYEVGPEFRNYFPSFFFPSPSGGDKGSVDLIAIARDQVIREGVSASHIFDAETCTACPGSGFFSYRRDSTLERILSVLQMRVH